MTVQLKVLVIEDSDSDAALNVRALEKAGYKVTYEVVATAKEMKAALHSQTFDLIISDHNLPQFDSLKALALLKENGLDIPFIVVSGTIGEETAVKVMKAGAHDYVMKGNLSRLGTAIERELREVKTRCERKHAENALKESEERYRDLVEQASDGICIIQDGLVKYSNSQLGKIWGGVAEEIIDTPFANYVHPDELLRVADHYNRRMAGEQLPSIYETALKRKDGSKVDTELNVGVIVYKAKPAELVIIRDITERKKAEEELIFKAQALDNANDSIFIHDFDNGTFVYFNEMMCRSHGYSMEEAASMKLPDLISPEQLQHRAERRQVTLRKGHHTFETVHLHKDGSTIPFEVRSRLIERDNKKYILNIARDITERKQFESEQERITKLESVGALAGGIAHDFNNILTAILGNISLARMEALPDSSILERLREAEKASLRAKDLTQQLLTFSKGGAPVRKLASLEEMLRDTTNFSLSGSNSKIQFSIPNNLWNAEIDQGQISQVINNLIINAQQAMPLGGTIVLRAENMELTRDQKLGKSLNLPKGKFIRISIIDQGTGIPAEYLPKIFDPFFTTKQRGNGLGLSTSFSIVRNHGGHISVESTLGTGSAFYVYLPASEKKVTQTQHKKETIKLAAGGKILVMDDEEVVRDVLGRMLKHIGCEDVEFAADGEEAMKLYGEAMKEGKPFDAVILDLTIPGGIGGKDVIRKLVKIDSGVKAIVSSGYTVDLDISKYKEYGFKGVVSKPYTLPQLRQTIYELIG
jgi:two-component system, cell cycle sensor histidine kinase and response regulator CckA